MEPAPWHLEQLCHGQVVVKDDGTLAPWVAKVDARRLSACETMAMGPRQKWAHLFKLLLHGPRAGLRPPKSVSQ